ncbi:PAS domain S-box protein [Tundrisphaera lichenicola]|uniref:PAS domain S-box protein n=1 Tax=Tundrisphaera lichenicola TaxID=2029860 RepID=UPI003EBA1A04
MGIPVHDQDFARPEFDHFRLLMESIRDYAIFTVDRLGFVSSWNAGACRTLGYAEAEVIGRPFSIFYTEEDVRSGIPDQELGSALSEGRALGERWHLRKGGSRIYCSGVLSPLFDRAGLHRGFGKVIRDLTERKRLEEELEAAESRFRAIDDQSPALTWRSDAEGRYDYFNRPWYDFRGEPPEHEIGEGPGWAEGVHPEDREDYLRTYRDAFARRAPFESLFRLRRHDGRYRWIIDRGVPYQDPRGQFLGFLGSCMDITDRVELEAALERQRSAAEEVSRHQNRLLSALSHDARTPLNAVLLAIEFLKRLLQGQADPEIESNLTTIRHSVGNVLELLGDLLSLSRIDAGVVSTQTSRFTLASTLAECLSGIEPQARQKGLELRLEPGNLAGASLEIDRIKFKQILGNLLSNALRYTDRGHIRLFTLHAEGVIQIAVEDSGVGIDVSDRVRIFDEFTMLNTLHRPGGEGTGLGLAISRRLSNLLQGEIIVESELGRGSTFTLVLPDSILVVDPSSSASVEEPAGRPASLGTILVAEDHDSHRRVLARILRKMGFQTLEAGNGQEALALARSATPLAILMDINMPLMDGIEAIRTLRAEPATSRVPIFALTGDVSDLKHQKIEEAGVTGLLEKPVSWEALEQTLGFLRQSCA